jgi:hypothetical protein
MRLRVALLLGLSVLGLSVMGASGLPLVGGSVPQTLLSERVYPAATSEPSNLMGSAGLHVRLHIINGFSAKEEANIVAAVVDWNRTGSVHLDVAALNFNAVEPGAWSISKADGGNASPAGMSVEPLVTAHAISADSGSIVVNVDRMADGELRSLVAQEFAKVFATTLLALSPNGTVITR